MKRAGDASKIVVPVARAVGLGLTLLLVAAPAMAQDVDGIAPGTPTVAVPDAEDGQVPSVTLPGAVDDLTDTVTGQEPAPVPGDTPTTNGTQGTAATLPGASPADGPATAGSDGTASDGAVPGAPGVGEPEVQPLTADLAAGTAAKRDLGSAVEQDARHFGWPLVLAVFVGLFLFFQGQVDRHEPKLADAPLDQGERLRFRS